MRKVGKRPNFKGCTKSVSQPTQEVKTNIEKKTQEKIQAMSKNDSLTMDFVLKNRKLMEHLKKCKVFLSKSMRKNLLKKYAVMTYPANKHKNAIRDTTKSKKQNPKKKPANDLSPENGPTTSDAVSMSSPNLRTTRVNAATSPASKSTKRNLSPQTHKSPKSDQSHGRNSQSPGPIFIRLPPKANKRAVYKRHKLINTIDKSKLERKFGKMVFKCHVRVKRLKKSDPLFTKKLKVHRKTVSFMETVEIFGGSDVEYESDEEAVVDESIANEQMMPAVTSTPQRKPTGGGTRKKEKKGKVEKSKINNLEKPARGRRGSKDEQNSKNSPPKKTSPKKEQNKSQQNQKAQKKRQRPKKKQEGDTTQTQLDLIEGKQCYVKLNRSSTSVLNASASSDEIMQINEQMSSDTNQNGGDDGKSITEKRRESEEFPVEINAGEDVEMMVKDKCDDANEGVADECNANNEGEPISLTYENDISDSQQTNDNGNERNEDNNSFGVTEDNSKNDIGREDDSENDENADTAESTFPDRHSDQINGKDSGQAVSPPTTNESFHSVNEDATADCLTARRRISEIAETSDLSNIQSRVSTPVQKLVRQDKTERRAVSMSPILSASKTNGTNQNKTQSTPLPIASTEDLFDLLKSNKLPEDLPTARCIPSPILDLSDDDDDIGIEGLDKANSSQMFDLLNDSNATNDSRFSLNTFFKSMKDKFISKRSGNDSPGSAQLSTPDDINLINTDGNLESATTQEISTQ